jgi:hypothetical protein
MNQGNYVLVQWPFSQDYMEQDWFHTECFLAQPINEDQDWVGSSAYFIPSERYNDFHQLSEADFWDGDESDKISY